MTAALEPDDIGVPPLHLNVPARAYSITDKVVRLCETIGRSHYPEQRLALEVMCGRRQDGRPASRTSAVICGRQNLKTYILENYVLTRLVDPTDDARLFVWTAQQLTTTEETYRNFLQIFTSDDFPHMQKRYKRSKSTNGAAEIELVDGRRIKFKARSVKSGQGLTGDVIVLDEGFAVEPEHLGSLIPTLSTRRRAQVLWGSSAAHGPSESLREIVERGRSGDKSLGYVEWAHSGSFADPGCDDAACMHVRGTPGCRLDDRESLRMANPLAGVRLEWEVLDEERKTLSAEIFARERLGWHMDRSSSIGAPFTIEKWDALARPGATSSGRPVFALDLSPARTAGAIAAATRMDDGTPLVEVIESGLTPADLQDAAVRVAQNWPGATWLAASDSAVKALIPALRDEGVVVKLLTAGEVATACGFLQDSIARGDLAHLGDPVLSDAIEGAARKDVADGAWIWTRRKSDVDISALYAVTLALWDLPPDYDVSASFG